MNLTGDELMKKLDEKLTAEAVRNRDIIPYIAVNGRYEDMRQKDLSWWTNGFFAGLLWQMYAKSGKEVYAQTAARTEEWLDAALERFEGLHHDVGFMYLLSAVADFRLTGNEKSRVQALHAATLLAGRYNPEAKFIRAWNHDMAGWMIIDCLMNLSLLYWASDETKDPRFRQIAMSHADTALRVLARPDGSVNHIGVLNPESGEVLELPAGQGYAPGSSWSRGQAWAVYGFAISAAHTKEKRYLDASKRAANYFIANASMTDWVSRVDFRSPEEPVYLDTTATACTASGLVYLADLIEKDEDPVSAAEARFYRKAAEKMLDALLAEHCDLSPETDGILQNGTAAYGHTDTHVPIIYGDYYLVEAILRLRGEGIRLW